MGQLRRLFESIHFECLCGWLVVQLLGFGECGIELARVLQLSAIPAKLEPDRRYLGSSECNYFQLLPHGPKSDERLHVGKCLYVGGGTWC
jgi:hypothetical protein